MKRPDPPENTALWIDGWYRFSSRLVSPNYGPRPPGATVDLIVLHSISLPPGQYGGDEVQQLFTNQLDWNQHPYFKSIEGMEVSSHFYIRRNGDLWQFVSVNDRAWHAGASCYRGRNNCNDDSIGIELEGIEGGLFEDSQYETLTGLCAALLQHDPIAHIAGHEHVAPGRKTDPGSGFKWPLLHQALGLTTGYFPDDVLS
ncbi:MAG: 1,6-anhydro-N-acetylmuramyl-L-alanine amidase AmpD [Pseudomonadota bacterium]